MQLLVTANKLNKRTSVPASLAEKNINGYALKGYRFIGTEVTNVPDPSLGKWYKDSSDYYYWGGGLLIEDYNDPQPPKHNFDVAGLPINLPAGCSLGMDVSHHNDRPDWAAAVHAGISFTYIKLSEGVGTPDNKAHEHATNAKANGLAVGYYHFCRPDTRNGGTATSDAQAEANEALSRMQPLPAATMPLVMDLEDESSWDTPLNKADYDTWISVFVSHIKGTTGIAPIIYSRKEYLDRKLPANHTLGDLKLWIANYGARNCDAVACPTGWKEWYMWQFSESAKVGGNAKLDLNIKKA